MFSCKNNVFVVREDKYFFCVYLLNCWQNILYYSWQLKVLTLNEKQGEINLADFIKSAPISKEELLSGVLSYIEKIEYSDVKEIVNKIFDDKLDKISEYPAATRNHHDYYCGLLHHTLGMLKIAENICDLHSNVDRSMLYAGAILHDIGKTVEFSGAVLPKYTVEGKLIGHISIMSALVKETANKLGYDNERVMLLQHMILSHHGNKEFGSPVLPLTKEAVILHFVDDLDSKMNILDKAYADVEEGNFTQRIIAMDGRAFYKPKKKSKF